MNTRALYATSALGTLVLASGLASLAGSVNAKPAHAAAVTRAAVPVRLVAHSKGFKQIDDGKSGPSVGDRVFEHGTLTQDGDKVGRFLMSASLVKGPVSHPCESQLFTFRLGQGSVQALGQHRASNTYTLAVVGGTGDYAQSTGTVRMLGHRNGAEVILHLQ